MNDVWAWGVAKIMKDNSQAETFMSKVASGLIPKQAGEMLFRDKLLFKVDDHSSSSHAIIRASDIVL